MKGKASTQQPTVPSTMVSPATPAKPALAQSPSATQGVSIGVKIFGIATSLLGLMLLVVFVSTHRLRKVNAEITDLAQYTIPITDRVAQIDVHALEQELHFERVLKLYEQEPLDQRRIRTEVAEFEKLDQLVNQELADAIALAKIAIEESKLEKDQAEWEQITPMLESIEAQHQQFHDHALEVLAVLQAGDMDKAHQLEEQIIVEETNFNQAVNDLFLELEQFTVESAKLGQQHQQTVQTLSVAIALIATAVGLVYAQLVSQGLVRPVRSLTKAMAAVQAGDLDISLPVSSRDEVGTLARNFNAMVKELRTKVHLEETFGKYVDPRIVQSLMDNAPTTRTEGDRRVMTVFFADVKGLEAVLSRLEPEAQVNLMNHYLNIMSAPITAHDGVIDKFIGTVMMGFWGPPFCDAQCHGQLACEAALEQIERLRLLQQHIQELTGEAAPLHLHIGLSTGKLVVGNMGSAAAKSYTVMGDTVNTASRLKGASHQYGVTVLMNEATQQQVADTMDTRELDLIQVVGKEEPVRIYELLGRKGDLSGDQLEAKTAFEAGLQAYRQQQWSLARAQFTYSLASSARAASTISVASKSQKIAPTTEVSTIPTATIETPATLYLDRIRLLEAQPPGEQWDGVWQLTQK